MGYFTKFGLLFYPLAKQDGGGVADDGGADEDGDEAPVGDEGAAGGGTDSHGEHDDDLVDGRVARYLALGDGGEEQVEGDEVIGSPDDAAEGVDEGDVPDLGGEDPAKGQEGDEPHAEVLQAAHAHTVSIGADLILGDEGGDTGDDGDKADGGC